VQLVCGKTLFLKKIFDLTLKLYQSLNSTSIQATGSDFFKLLEHYNLELDENEKDLLITADDLVTACRLYNNFFGMRY